MTKYVKLGQLMQKEIIYTPAALRYQNKTEIVFNVLVENFIIYKIQCMAENMED